MMNEKKLTREEIIKTLINVLEPLDYVYAFWEGGAVAFNRLDEWSDLDLYLVVDDHTVNDTFLAFENALESMSSIKQKIEVQHPAQSGLFQAFYRLDDAGEYLIIDLAVLTFSSPDKFLEPEIHGNVVFYFNKSGKIGIPPLNKDGLISKLQERLVRLRERFDMFNNFVQKEINRGNCLEAIGLYYAYTLASLVEVMRIRYYPVHHSFRMQYIHYELPSELIEKLKGFYFVKDLADLQEKYLEASKWFREVISEIDREEIETMIRKL